MIWFSATLAPSIAIRCFTIRAEQDAGRRLHLLWSVLLHGEAPVKDMPPRSFYLHSVTLGHCLLDFAACTFRLRQVANNHAFRSFFPTLLPNILIELPLGRILPIWA